MKMKNDTKGTVVADQVFIADTFLKRLQGLLGKPPLTAIQGLVIKPCNSVHTVGMGYPIDVLFLDDSHRIVQIAVAMLPGSVKIVLGSSYVVELAASRAQESSCSVGDKISLEL